MWAARPIMVSMLFPCEDKSKLTSQRMKTRGSEDLARIWSKHWFSISRKALPFFDLSPEDAGHISILAE